MADNKKNISSLLCKANLLGGVYFVKVIVNNINGELKILLIYCITTPFTILLVP